jgi:hypothetical protein
MAQLQHSVNQTLAAVDAAMEAAQESDPRPYIGMSGIGNPCIRAVWYGKHWAKKRTMAAKSLRAIQDGFGGEDVMASRLRMVKGITLHTVDPATGKQFSLESHGGHVRGHMDGAIQGILEAPQTWHVWEHKQVNETKFNKLQKLVAELGEKNALEQWDAVYFAQAQMYMGNTGMDRHFLTVATPGGRDYMSVRTEFQKDKFAALEQRAQMVIDAQEPPERIGGPDWFECKWCDYASICHGTEAPAVNCRTCAHSTAAGGGSWACERTARVMSIADQREGCVEHRINPTMIKHWAEIVSADHNENVVTYRHLKSGTEFMNGPGPDGFSSKEIQACADKDFLGIITTDEYLMNLRKQFGGVIV